MDLDQECHLPAGKKSLLEDDKRVEKNFLPNRLNSLKKRSEFLFIRNSGKSKNSQFFIINYLFSKTDEVRFGITVSRKYGNVVKRNYTKRIIRSILTKNINVISNGLSFEIIPKKNLKNKNFSQSESDLIEIIKELVI